MAAFANDKMNINAQNGIVKITGQHIIWCKISQNIFASADEINLCINNMDDENYSYYQSNALKDSPESSVEYTDYSYFDYDHSEFECEQKVGRNNITLKNFNTTICPSRQCMVFYDFCDNFWATSCFAANSPMHLAKKYKGVQKRHRNTSSTSFSKFYFCISKNCTVNLYNQLNKEFMIPETFITPEPISFDFKLWPKSRKEQPPKNKKLKNGFAIEEWMFKDEKLVFYGETLPNAQKLWVQFQFLNDSGNFNYFKFTLNSDSANLIMTYKSGKMIKSHAWRGFIKEKNEIQITYKKSDAYKFFVNNFSLNFTLQKNITGDLFNIYYGGHWDIVYPNGQSNELHYPNVPTKNISCPEDMTLVSPDMNVTNVERYFSISSTINIFSPYANFDPNATFYISTLENFETKSFELRASLCPGADIIRIDVTVIKHAKNTYIHPNIWYRRNLRWTKFWNYPLQKPECKEIKVVASEPYIWFICGNDKAPVDNIFRKKLKYLVQEKKKRFVCGK